MLVFGIHGSCRAKEKAYTAFVGSVHTYFSLKQYNCLMEKAPEIFSHAVTCLAAEGHRDSKAAMM